MKTKTFVNCGFEFTAAAKKNRRINSNVLYTSRVAWYGKDALEYNYSNRNCISTYDWINERFSKDSCGCEVSTPIIRNNAVISTYFNDFIDFVNTTNLTVDIDEARCCLGGCHIHLSTPTFSNDIHYKKIKLFVRNIGVFMTNYPQLNWGFNDPNDNENANSLLDEPNLFNNFCNDPLNELSKHYSIRYNEDYQTIEFRIFDMPVNLKQHLLHYDVAKAIYGYCLRYTLNNKKIKPKYTDFKQCKFSKKEAINEFYKALNLLHIDKKRVSKMVQNIHLRYIWDKENRKENYLL